MDRGLNKLAQSGRSLYTARGIQRKFDPGYFKWPSLFFMILISFGVCILLASTFQPERIPTFLGPIGAFAKFVGRNYPNVCMALCIVTLIIHILEAIYAGTVCISIGMTAEATLMWVFSTFLFGFSSLMLRLLPYKKEHNM